MKKIWILVVLILVAVFGGRVWYLNKNKTDETDIVKIGALVPLSGQMAFEGKMVVSALNMIADKMNTTRNIKVEIVPEDDKYTAKDSISAFRKLQSQNIDLYFVYGDLPAKAILSIAEEKQLPLFAVAESKELNDSPVVVNLSPSSVDWTNSISTFVNSKLKPKNIAIIYQKDMAHMESTARLKEHFKNLIPIINQEQFDPNSLEVRPVVSKILNYKPDVIIVLGYGSTYVSILNTIREQGYTGTIVSDLNVSSIKENLAKTSYPLYWTDTLFDDNSGITEIDNFLTEFKAKYNAKPSTFTMMSYVGVQSLINAIKTKDYKPMEVILEIQKTKDLPTVLGNLSIDNTKFMQIPIVIKQMQPDGTAKVVKE